MRLCNEVNISVMKHRMHSQSEEKQANCLGKNASNMILSLAFLRVSALPELNYTALANEASVCGAQSR